MNSLIAIKNLGCFFAFRLSINKRSPHTEIKNKKEKLIKQNGLDLVGQNLQNWYWHKIFPGF